MYLKYFNKDGKEYFILCAVDKNKKWFETFITKAQYNALLNVGVKLYEKK